MNIRAEFKIVEVYGMDDTGQMHVSYAVERMERRPILGDRWVPVYRKAYHTSRKTLELPLRYSTKEEAVAWINTFNK